MTAERDIVAKLAAAFPLPGGIGDDAADLAQPDGSRLLVAKDVLVEDIHFRRRYCSPADIARKALEVNLSDIAAMGGRPDHVLLGLSLPPDLAAGWSEDFLDAFSADCRARDVALIGGDTTGSPDRLFISITVLGRVAAGHLKRRGGARAGDVVFVAGPLGHARLGLLALESGRAAPSSYLDALRRPRALLAEGAWLAGRAAVTAMMDISDGLFTDLGRLCAASGCGANIDCGALPRDAVFDKTCAAFGETPVKVVLEGGEDYSLLFTAAADQAADLAESFAETFGYELTAVGVMNDRPDSGVVLAQDGKAIDLSLRPFSHFGE